MSDLSLGCHEVTIIQQPEAVFTVQEPDNELIIIQQSNAIFTTQPPDTEVVVVQNPDVTFTVEEPEIDINIVLPIGGPPGPEGPQGPPGSSVGEASLRYTYLEPVELPDGIRTQFTVPQEYVLGTLAVYLNGLQEHYISQTTNTTFSFETAPLPGDTLKIDFNTLN